MSRRTRAGLIVAAAGVVLAVGAVLAVRAALDPERLRSMAEAQLTSALGQPVRIGRMDVHLLPAPSVEGRNIAVGSPGAAAGSSLALDTIRIVPRLATILSTPIEIDRVELNGLAIDARRDDDGALMLPLPSGTAPAAAAEGESRLAVNRIVLRDGRIGIAGPAGGAGLGTGASIEGIEAVIGRQGDVTVLESLNATVGESKVTGSGRAGPDGLKLSLALDALKPRDAAVLFALAGVEPPAGFAIEGDRPLALDVEVGPDGAIAASGRLAAARLALGTLSLSAVEVPIRLGSGRLSLEPLTFAAYGGKARGGFRAEVGASPMTWTLETRIDGIDAGALIGAVAAGDGRLDGTGRVDAALRGRTGTPLPQGLTGRVGFELADGVIRDFALLSALDAALGLDEAGGRDFQFSRLGGAFEVAGGRATTTDLAARAGTVHVAARGSLGLDGDLSFTGTATFSREKSQELIRRVRELSGAKNARGEIEVPFDVSGTVSAPQFSVNTARILGRAAEKELERQIRRRLQGLIRKK